MKPKKTRGPVDQLISPFGGFCGETYDPLINRTWGVQHNVKLDMRRRCFAFSPSVVSRRSFGMSLLRFLSFIGQFCFVWRNFTLQGRVRDGL